MKIVIAGGSGFIGSHLVERLAAKHEVLVLTRRAPNVPGFVRWNPAERSGDWVDAVASADVVINLAGANIGEKRWSAKRKQELVSSRLGPTAALVAAMRSAPRARTFISTSAVGYYGTRGDEILTESSPPGESFLARLCVEWENAAREAEAVARVVIPRFGVVFDRSGGVLPKLVLQSRLFAGGPLAGGRQWISWIDLEDAIRMYEWMIDSGTVSGVYNAVAPDPTRNRDMMRELGRQLGRPSIIPAPELVIRLALGEMGEELLLASQRAVPARLLSHRFCFDAATIRRSLARILA